MHSSHFLISFANGKVEFFKLFDRRSFRKKIASSFLAACLLFPVLGLAQKMTVTPTDIANLKAIEAPRLSPDGKLIVYTLDTPVAAGKHRDAHIWIVPTNNAVAAHPFVYSSASDSAPDWSPDGTHLAFLSDRPNSITANESSPFRFSLSPDSDRKAMPESARDAAEADSKGMQLWWIALNGGEAEPLTNFPGSIRSFKWSPDGKSIALILTDSDTKEEADRKKAKHDEVTVDHDYHYDRLWIYDLAQRQARLLTKTDLNVDAIDWAPSGQTIVARVSPTPRLDDYWRVSKVVLFDTHTGAITRTLEEHSGYSEPSFSRDGLRVVFSRFTPRGITDIHIVENLSDGKEITLEDKLHGTISEMHWAGDGSQLLVLEYVATHTETFRVDTASFTISLLPGIPATVEHLHPSRDGYTICFLGETPTQPAEVYAWRDERAQILTSSNPQVARWDIGSQREISWKNPNDHRTIYGVIVLPPGFQVGVRYRTVVHVHGGPEEAWTIGFNGNWYNYATMLASHGYVVLLPNPRGSDGQGPTFTEADYQDWGGGDFADVMAGVDYLIAQGITNPDRMVIGGWSFGGFMTDWAVTHTERFKAGMSGAGVSDLYSMATTTDISPTFERSYMGELSSNAKVYDDHSPVRFIDHCHTPILVLHGEADPRVPISQSEEFYHGLRFLGKDAVMVQYPREPHIFAEREHQIDSLTRILAWYDSHVAE